MKVWVILGLLLLTAAVVEIFFLGEDTAPQRSVEAYMIEMVGRLEEYADQHEGRYPESLEELDLVGISNRAAQARDPWGRFFVYERHPSDRGKYRFFTLGKDGLPATKRDPTEIVVYRVEGRTFWKQSLLDVPREW